MYVEGGYSDGAKPGYTARVLKAVRHHRIRGFYTNDTHINWTIKEIRWGEKVSRLVGGTHFVVNTSDSGRGPLLNANPARQGVEDLCNPPGRGAGPRPTADTGYSARRRLPVDPRAGREQRALQRGHAVRDLLARAHARRGRERERRGSDRPCPASRTEIPRERLRKRTANSRQTHSIGVHPAGVFRFAGKSYGRQTGLAAAHL